MSAAPLPPLSGGNTGVSVWRASGTTDEADIAPDCSALRGLTCSPPTHNALQRCVSCPALLASQLLPDATLPRTHDPCFNGRVRHVEGLETPHGFMQTFYWPLNYWWWVLTKLSDLHQFTVFHSAALESCPISWSLTLNSYFFLFRLKLSHS